MAYFDEDMMQEKLEKSKSKSITELLFEEKKCVFGQNTFSIRLPRKPLVNAIFRHPPAGSA